MVNESAIEYATAIFEVALEENKVNDYFEQVLLVKDTLLKERDFLRLLEHPKIYKKEKRDMISNVFHKIVNRDVLHFIYILVDHNRIRHLEDIMLEFTKLVNDYHKVLNVQAFTTIELKDKQVRALVDKLEQKYKRKINIENHIDPSVIGGMRLVIGEEIIDNTLKTQFATLRSVLK